MTTTSKMTAVAGPTLFNLGGKDYYLVEFTRKELREKFCHREVKQCLIEAGHIPADVCEDDDEILTHPKLVELEHLGWVGIFGRFSQRHEDKERVAFFDLRTKRLKRLWPFHQDAGNRNLPYPVLCCK